MGQWPRADSKEDRCALLPCPLMPELPVVTFWLDMYYHSKLFLLARLRLCCCCQMWWGLCQLVWGVGFFPQHTEYVISCPQRYLFKWFCFTQPLMVPSAEVNPSIPRGLSLTMIVRNRKETMGEVGNRKGGHGECHSLRGGGAGRTLLWERREREARLCSCLHCFLHIHQGPGCMCVGWQEGGCSARNQQMSMNLHGWLRELNLFLLLQLHFRWE